MRKLGNWTSSDKFIQVSIKIHHFVREILGGPTSWRTHFISLPTTEWEWGQWRSVVCVRKRNVPDHLVQSLVLESRLAFCNGPDWLENLMVFWWMKQIQSTKNCSSKIQSKNQCQKEFMNIEILKYMRIRFLLKWKHRELNLSQNCIIQHNSRRYESHLHIIYWLTDLLTYLLTHSMEQIPPWEANRFPASQ